MGALGFGLVVYLGFNGGGYDPLIHDQIGIAAWWVLLTTVLVGAIPRGRLPLMAWVVLALFAAFAVWSLLSLTWTESVEKTYAEVARLGTYLGVLILAVFASDRKSGVRVAAGVGAGIACLAVAGLLTRLQPDWFPGAAQTGELLLSSRERLSYPINYWNGLAILIAIGFPLVLQMTTSSTSRAIRALAAAALPAMALASFFTLSRSGLLSLTVAIVLFLAISARRVVTVIMLIAAGAGSAVLIVWTTRHEALQHGLQTADARHQGDKLLLLTLFVCGVVALVNLGISRIPEKRLRLPWTPASKAQAVGVGLAVTLAVLVLGAAVNLPGRASSAWDEFRTPSAPGNGTQRLTSAAGEARYQFWGSALDENATDPLRGTGAGTFELWWARNADANYTVRDAHSLYLQTLGEVGVVGGVLLAAFVLTVLFGGARAVLRAPTPVRSQLAAALAGAAAFCVGAAFDWIWQIPVLPVVFILLAAALVTALPSNRPQELNGRAPQPLAPGYRIVFTLLALGAIALIAIPLASTAAIRRSQSDARAGDLAAALDEAQSAVNAEPTAATPRLQQALLFEAEGALDPAARAAVAATERETTNWRTWMVLSRVEAERGKASAEIRAYRRARALNPRFSLFAR